MELRWLGCWGKLTIVMGTKRTKPQCTGCCKVYQAHELQSTYQELRSAVADHERYLDLIKAEYGAVRQELELMRLGLALGTGKLIETENKIQSVLDELVALDRRFPPNA